MPITKDEYIRARKQLEADYHKRLEALELAWSLVGEKPNGTNHESLRKSLDAAINIGERLVATVAGHANPGLKHSVQNVIADLHSNFTIRDVVAGLDRKFPGFKYRIPSVSTCLLNLLAAGELALVERGAGRAPTIYKKK